MIEKIKKNLEKTSYLEDADLDWLLENIGNPVGEIRDQGVYPLFCSVIKHQQIKPKKMKKMLLLLLSIDFLFKSIETPISDAVFYRSFSALLIAVLIDSDAKQPILTSKELEKVVLTLCAYYVMEQDTRGFVTYKGWAHAIAHGADVFLSLAEHPLLESENQLIIMLTVLSKLEATKSPLNFGEPMRMMEIFNQLFQKDPSNEERFIRLVTNLNERIKNSLEKNQENYWIRFYNLQQFYNSFLQNSATPEKVRHFLAK